MLQVQSNLSYPGSVGPTGARMCENAHNSEYSGEETDRCDFPSSSILIASSFLSRSTTLHLRVTEAITRDRADSLSSKIRR